VWGAAPGQAPPDAGWGCLEGGAVAATCPTGLAHMDAEKACAQGKWAGLDARHPDFNVRAVLQLRQRLQHLHDAWRASMQVKVACQMLGGMRGLRCYTAACSLGLKGMPHMKGCFCNRSSSSSSA